MAGSSQKVTAVPDSLHETREKEREREHFVHFYMLAFRFSKYVAWHVSST